jgi:arsenate reductase (thioredoxin)
MARVLFVCLHNAGRSQISHALFERAAQGRHNSASAGTQPGERVHPQVVQAMLELDLDLSDRRPRALTRDLAEWADVVVTMGCGDECPYIPGKRYVDWDLEDPSGQSVERVRETRDDIAERVRELVSELDDPDPRARKTALHSAILQSFKGLLLSLTQTDSVAALSGGAHPEVGACVQYFGWYGGGVGAPSATHPRPPHVARRDDS